MGSTRRVVSLLPRATEEAEEAGLSSCRRPFRWLRPPPVTARTPASSGGWAASTWGPSFRRGAPERARPRPRREQAMAGFGKARKARGGGDGARGELAVVMRGCGCVHGDERGVEAHEFKRRPAALLRPWTRLEGARRGVGWSRGCTGGREGQRSREGARGGLK